MNVEKLSKRIAEMLINDIWDVGDESEDSIRNEKIEDWAGIIKHNINKELEENLDGSM